MAGEERGEDAAVNNQSSISFHHALNQADVIGTHEPRRLQAADDGQRRCHSESQVHTSCYRGEWVCSLLPSAKILCIQRLEIQTINLKYFEYSICCLFSAMELKSLSR